MQYIVTFVREERFTVHVKADTRDEALDVAESAVPRAFGNWSHAEVSEQA